MSSVRSWIAPLTAVAVGLAAPAANLGEPSATPPAWAFCPHFKAVVVPLYADGEPKPVAVLSIERAFTDYQRRGFFRIGLLPMWVADGVWLEVLQPAKAAAAFRGVLSYLQLARGGVPVELRRLGVAVAREPLVRLKAGRARIADAGNWVLDGGVSVTDGPAIVEGSRATLEVTGPKAGQIVLATVNEERTVRFFGTLK